MKLWTLVPVFVVAVGCSGGSKDSDSGSGTASVQPSSAPTPSKKDDAKSSLPKEAEKFGDDVFVVPTYPGSEHMPYTGIEMDTDIAHVYARHFTTPDDLDKVETFIKTEGEKLGKYDNPAKGVFNEKLIRNGEFDLPDGKKLIFKLMRDDKGNKTDIMYNMAVPKKK